MINIMKAGVLTGHLKVVNMFVHYPTSSRLSFVHSKHDNMYISASECAV